ncbi:hypothetical protein P4O66_001863 [Electrophorus voltai]|uniref:DNA-directed DNA polymerase n=1 Tax=Electrophorus voltai TaxID=2609070 RepID=A0AAD8Z669_9TELE|nr:hypothetical protein P4O66_001863 [Electrophorus voltai]
MDTTQPLSAERLNPRDALFGGRTNALQLYYTAQPGGRIDYYDFTSLYPYVDKVGQCGVKQMCNCIISGSVVVVCKLQWVHGSWQRRGHEVSDQLFKALHVK